MLRFVTLAGLLASATALADPAPPVPPPAYRLTATLPLGTPDHWDSLSYDQTNQRLFIAHGTEITVVSVAGVTAHGPAIAIAGHIAGFDGARGIALVPGGFGYAANGNAGTVVVFDKSSLQKLRGIPAGAGPAAITYDPASHNVFAVNGETGNIAVITTGTNTVVATIAAGGKLAEAAADGQGHLFVNQADTGSLLRINTTTNAVSATWKLPGCDAPHGLALDQWNTHVFTSCENGKLIVVDGTNGHILAQAAIGFGSGTVIYDSGRHLVFSSNSDGTLSVIDAVSLLATAPLTTAPGARTMAVDPINGHVFLVTADVASQSGTPGASGARDLTFKPGTVKLLVLSPAS